VRVVNWPSIQNVVCAACGGSFGIPTPDLLSLQAVCPGCGASLASVGEERLTWYAGYCREVDLFVVGFELQETGVELLDSEVDAARSLEDLTRAVTGHLTNTTDREARAAELVTKVARRFAPDLLEDADYLQRFIQRASAAWRRRRGGQAESSAAPDPARFPGT
jgi:hypothetical protein